MIPTILITIDVEDWFQVENFRPWIPFETWDQRELRVENNTHRLLDLFDSIELQPPSLPASKPQTDDYELSAMSYEKSHPKATFFILGWLAERLPHLVREILSRGHEIASHGYNHNLCNQLSDIEFKKDLIDSKNRLQDITGSAVAGYRAPNFSVNDDVLKIVEDCGFGYDSSYNSFGLHGRYGKISLNGHTKKGIAHRISDNFFELPISNLMLKGRAFPLGGGGYFRLIPFSAFKMGVKRILKNDGVYVFYAHPWEFDPDQPVVKNASTGFKFRHYLNLRKNLNKLDKFIDSFSGCQFITCSQYLETLRQD